MKPELLLVRAIYEPAGAALEREFSVHKLWTAPDPDAYLRQACGNVRAVVTTTTVGFTRRDFEALPRLEILACFGPYVDLVDLAAAKDRGFDLALFADMLTRVDRLRRDEFEVDDAGYERLRREVDTWRSRTLELVRRARDRDIGIDR